MPAELLPSGILTNREAIIGKHAKVDLDPNAAARFLAVCGTARSEGCATQGIEQAGNNGGKY